MWNIETLRLTNCGNRSTLYSIGLTWIHTRTGLSWVSVFSFLLQNIYVEMKGKKHWGTWKKVLKVDVIRIRKAARVNQVGQRPEYTLLRVKRKVVDSQENSGWKRFLEVPIHSMVQRSSSWLSSSGPCPVDLSYYLTRWPVWVLAILTGKKKKKKVLMFFLIQWGNLMWRKNNRGPVAVKRKGRMQHMEDRQRKAVKEWTI